MRILGMQRSSEDSCLLLSVVGPVGTLQSAPWQEVPRKQREAGTFSPQPKICSQCPDCSGEEESGDELGMLVWEGHLASRYSVFSHSHS